MRVRETEQIPPSYRKATLMHYTQCKFDRREVLSMEGELLASIGSYLHPPTAGSFCLIFLSGFSSFPMSVASAIDNCHFMIALAACGKRERTPSSMCCFFSPVYLNLFLITAWADFFFVLHKQSKLAVAAIVVTLEQTNMSLESIRRSLSNSKSVNDFTKDRATMACVTQLRKIYAHNHMRIEKIDGECCINVSTTDTANPCDLHRVCRVATPSPTPDDVPEYVCCGIDSNKFSNLDGGGGKQCPANIDTGQRKRVRREV